MALKELSKNETNSTFNRGKEISIPYIKLYIILKGVPRACFSPFLKDSRHSTLKVYFISQKELKQTNLLIIFFIFP